MAGGASDLARYANDNPKAQADSEGMDTIVVKGSHPGGVPGGSFGQEDCDPFRGSGPTVSRTGGIVVLRLPQPPANLWQPSRLQDAEMRLRGAGFCGAGLTADGTDARGDCRTRASVHSIPCWFGPHHGCFFAAHSFRKATT